MILLPLVLTACAKDVRQFCVQVPNERFWLEKCLQNHRAALSSNCETAAGRKIEWRASFADHCNREREKFCSNVSGDKEFLIPCLKEHQSNLGASCAQWVAHE